MATQSNNSSKTKAQSKRPAAATAVAEKNQIQAAAETAVDLPVGAVLSVNDRLSELVEPWTDRDSAAKQLKVYRTRLRKTLKRTERRGHSARRRAASEARKTRNRVEREARKHQRSVEGTLKRNRNEVERRVRRVTDQLAALR
jgi:hypothetical protein